MMLKRRNKGVVSIEFAMGFMMFWWLCMALVEVSYMSYVSAVTDLAVSEASRASRLEDQVSKDCVGSQCFNSYSARFKQALYDNQSLWAKLIDHDKFEFSVQYLKSQTELENLKDDFCPLGAGEKESECGKYTDSAIAVYRVNYAYQPMFNYFINSSQLFTREAIVVQEYERDQFNF
ncbi:TadE family protein [Vibrio panuliri]